MTRQSPVRGWVPDPPAGTNVRLLDPRSIRFSQNTISGPTRLHGDPISMPGLIDGFRRDGFVADPIQAVTMPDGHLTSLDNRRLWAALAAGVSAIPTEVHEAAERFDSPIQARFLRARRAVLDAHGEVGPQGAVLMERGALPTCMLDAVILRCHRQSLDPDGTPFPLFGSLTPPHYSGEKREPAPASADLRPAQLPLMPTHRSRQGIDARTGRNMNAQRRTDRGMER